MYSDFNNEKYSNLGFETGNTICTMVTLLGGHLSFMVNFHNQLSIKYLYDVYISPTLLDDHMPFTANFQ